MNLQLIQRSLAPNRIATRSGLWTLCFLSLLACSEPFDKPATQFTPVALQTANTTEVIGSKLVGVGSCTASGCHGNGKPNEIAGSEYNIWISADPHSRAFSVLYDDRSVKMLQQLDGKTNGADVSPHEDQRCLACHSSTFAAPLDSAGDVVSDGVGCEACHGPAEGWLTEHYRPGFDAAARHRLGIWDTKGIYSRAQICTSCHVGGPGREVNHALVAAGHPRLQFEMGAYLQALPKHWDERADRDRSGGSFEFLTWMLGHTATSKAALEQLERRSTNAAVWPELSEWSCGACHHDLLDTASRQDSLASSGGLSGKTIRWDDWNHHLVREHAGLIASALGNQGSANDLQQQLAEVARIAGGLRSDRELVATAAREASKTLDTWARLIQSADINLATVDALMRSLTDTYVRGVADTSEAMLVYDALATLQQTRLDKLTFEKKPPDDVDQAITASLAAMYESLTKKDDTPIAEITRIQSVAAHLTDLARLLEQRGAGE
jgi:hypothetical protein